MAAGDRHTGRVDVAGGELEYDIVGRATGVGRAPVVFLHGWTLDRRMWASQTSAFQHRTVVTVDRRGCGGSTAPYDLDRERDDVLALADHLGLESFVLVGMSQAGHVASEVAGAQPSRVAGLVLQGVRLGPVAEGAQPDIPIERYRDLVRAGRVDEMKALWRDHALMRPVDPALQPVIDAMLDSYDGADLIDSRPKRAALDWDRLAQLPMPALIVTGDRDTALRRTVAKQLARTLADASEIEIRGAGHMCNMCAPAAYNAALKAFLDRLRVA